MKNVKKAILFALMASLNWGCENLTVSTGCTDGNLVAWSATLYEGVYVEVPNDKSIGKGSVETPFIPEGGNTYEMKPAKEFNNLCMVVNYEVLNLPSYPYPISNSSDSLTKVNYMKYPLGFQGRKVSFEYRIVETSEKEKYFREGVIDNGMMPPFRYTEKDMTFIYITKICQ
jgi:hypothetical protein